MRGYTTYGRNLSIGGGFCLLGSSGLRSSRLCGLCSGGGGGLRLLCLWLVGGGTGSFALGSGFRSWSCLCGSCFRGGSLFGRHVDGSLWLFDGVCEVYDGGFEGDKMN